MWPLSTYALQKIRPKSILLSNGFCPRPGIAERQWGNKSGESGCQQVDGTISFRTMISNSNDTDTCNIYIYRKYLQTYHLYIYIYICIHAHIACKATILCMTPMEKSPFVLQPCILDLVTMFFTLAVVLVGVMPNCLLVLWEICISSLLGSESPVLRKRTAFCIS